MAKNRGKIVEVIQESETGFNQVFRNTKTNEEMSRSQFVGEIQQGNYPSYHIRELFGKKTPVSNPDSRKGNNLG